ncbi:MAG TPA: hypothetical protein VIG36_10880 [Methylocystis sp.]|jgi:hypothetical protein
MSEITRRHALQLGAAALASAVVPATAAIAPTPTPTLLPAWFVGTAGEWDWEFVRGATGEDAILNYLAEQGLGIVCEAVEEGEPAPPDDCDCEFCMVKGRVDAERKPRLDNVRRPTKAQMFENGLGQLCDRCGYEAFPNEDGYAVGSGVICSDCMTIEDWEVVDPERAAELRAEKEMRLARAADRSRD